MDIISRFQELLRRRDEQRRAIRRAQRRNPELVAALERGLATLQTEIDAALAEAAKEEK